MIKHNLLIVCLCFTPFLIPQGAAFISAAEVLSDSFPKGEKTATVEQIQPLLGGSHELDQLAGVAQLMNIAGPAEAVPVLAKAMNKSKYLKLPEVAGLIATSTKRTEHIKAMLTNPATRELGAASLAAMAVVEYVFNERFTQAGEIPKIPDPNEKKKKGGGNKGSSLDISQAYEFSTQIGELLKDKDEALVEYGLIAAAYTADVAHMQAINALRPRSGGIMGLKLLYAVRTKQHIDEKTVNGTFTSSCRGETFEHESGFMTRCQTLVPSAASAAEAIGLMGEAGAPYLQELHSALTKEKDIRTQVAAAIAIGRVRSENSISTLLEAMEKCEWPVLVHVLDALGRIPSAKSLGPLIKRYAKEKGRFRLDCLYAINSIAGERLAYNTEEELIGWWKTTAPSFAPDRQRTDEFRAKYRVIDMGPKLLSGFYGARIYSDRLAFVLDSSNSMKGEKIENLREQTAEAIAPLIPLGHVKANVVDFGGMVEVYYKDALTDELKGMSKYVTVDMDLSGGTRSMDAFLGGLKLDGVDSIYFLSDGAPVRSIREAWEDIRRYVAFMNRYRPVAVFSIGFKASVSGYMGMAQLSWENSGMSERIE